MTQKVNESNSPCCKIKLNKTSMKECTIKSVDVMFAQMSAKSVIKRLVESAVAVVINEFRQIEKGVIPGKPVLKGIETAMFAKEYRQALVETVNLIKEKG